MGEAVREKFGTQAAFAEDIGASEEQVSRWISRGQRPIRVHKEAICKALSMKPEELWP